MYKVLYYLVAAICWPLFQIFCRWRITGLENVPAGGAIIAPNHQSIWDIPLVGLALHGRRTHFMAKSELFKNPVLRFILNHAHAFPVDRKNPGPSALKVPVKGLRKGKLSLIIFPSGTRHSAELKGGALVISKMSKKPMVPVVYQGPLSFKGLLKRKPMEVNFGNPITIDKKTKLTHENEQIIYKQLEDAWDQLDKELNPNFHYVAK